MKIMFILPALYRNPVGGYKIVYEYASRFAERGHDVEILYNSRDSLKKVKMPLGLRNLICNAAVKKIPSWFTLHKAVRQRCIPEFDEKYLAKADIVFATAMETAAFVEQLGADKGKKYYLVQGYESWAGTDQEIRASFRYKDMHKILVASWLKKYMQGEERVTVISNPIDTGQFYVTNEIKERNPYSIALLYHESENKGLAYALEALHRLKELHGEIEVRMFGVPERPAFLPDWIEYTEKADSQQLLEIYNKSAIFLCAAVQEGFGLTGAEAMACGCTLVSTEYEGVLEYAVHMENALLGKVKDVDALVKNVVTLWENDELRIRLAQRGVDSIKENSWDAALDCLEKLFREEKASEE